MAIIQFKRGTTGPTGLTLGEPAWEYDDNKFYIGVTSSAIWVGAGITTGDVGVGSTLIIPTQSAVKTYVLANSGSSISGVTLLNGFTGSISITGGTGISVTTGPTNVLVKNILSAGFKLIEGVTFTSSTTYTIPSGAKIIFGEVISSGGGGAPGGITQSSPGLGGGGGAGGAFYEFFVPDAQTIGATCTVVIGLGGQPTTSFVEGLQGGDSQFHTYYFPGSPGGSITSTVSNLGYLVDNVVKSNTFHTAQNVTSTATITNAFTAGAGASARSGSNNDGYMGRKGYRGGGGGGGGGSQSSFNQGGFNGREGGNSSNIITDSASSGLTGWKNGGGGRGGTGAVSVSATATTGLNGEDGTALYGGAGGGGGGSSGTGIGGNGGAGGYPGGGGGGGGGSAGLTRAAGGTGGDARIMIWVYG